MIALQYLLEVIAFTIESVRIAQTSGAHRIELCDNPADGGTTPSFGLLRLAREASTLPIYPIIRPRGGDFLYSDEEYAVMLNDVRVCKDLGYDGIVLGILRSDGTIDRERMSRVIELAYPLGVTLHRAFDRVRDAQEALETAIELGCERILTSGLTSSAVQGAAMIRQLIQWADERIVVMPGAGVRSNNLLQLLQETSAREFHSSARRLVDSDMEYTNDLMDETLKRIQLDGEEVKKMAAILREAALDNHQ